MNIKVSPTGVTKAVEPPLVRDLHALYLPVRRKVISALNDYNKTRKTFVDIFETMRSDARQNYLYTVRKASKVKVSLHQLGIAVDLYPTHADGGWFSGPELDAWTGWDDLARVLRFYGLERCADWDKCHYQSTYGLNESALVSLFDIKGLGAVWARIDEARKAGNR